MSRNPVDALLTAITSATIAETDVFADDAVIDAVVPNWRFPIRGAAAIRAEFGDWYADPGRFEELRRTPVPDGELVEFTLGWDEGGVPHAARQIHVLTVEGEQIVADRVWCGGRWPASLRAEMDEAARARV